jgi:hypothetical protein
MGLRLLKKVLKRGFETPNVFSESEFDPSFVILENQTESGKSRREKKPARSASPARA